VDSYGAVCFDRNPFYLLVIEGEKLIDTKRRMKELVQLQDDIIEIRIIGKMQGFTGGIPVGDDAELSDKVTDGDVIVIIHNVEERRQIKHRIRERAMKIYN
jgi:hypothetical protein